jgi:hypothetical protein
MSAVSGGGWTESTNVMSSEYKGRKMGFMGNVGRIRVTCRDYSGLVSTGSPTLPYRLSVEFFRKMCVSF